MHAPSLTASRPAALTALAAAALLAACAPLAVAPASEAPPRQAGADCLPLLRALLIAREQPQVSQYRVDDSALPVSMQPSAWRVGDLLHETEGGMLVMRQLAPGQDPLVEALQAEQAAGRAWCQVVASEPGERYQGLPVSRIHFRHPQLPARYHPTSVLVDRASGRPLWHGYTGMEGGYAWVYGSEASVRQPATSASPMAAARQPASSAP